MPNEFDIQSKGLDKIPVPPLKKDLSGGEVKNPDKLSEEAIYTFKDIMAILKYQLQRFALMFLSKEPKPLSFYIELIILVLVILALSLTIIFPKLGLI